MIYTNLYEEVLIKPCREGADTLKIISGYATSAMAFHHLEELRKKRLEANISLLLGMCPTDGISLSNHNGFLNIINSNYSSKFSCSYIFKLPSVHSKIYIWYRRNKLYKSFIGSANYTQNAFFKKQREILSEIRDSNVTDYYKLLEKDSIYCNNQEIESLIPICNDRNYYPNHPHEEVSKDNSIHTNNLKRITLLDKKTGEVQKKAGLNWGQRPEYRRNPNQAYIQLPPDVYKSDFFPPKPQHFTVTTDDSKTFICCRAQKTGTTGAAIETPHNNALLGEYFRNRLELSNGAPIWKKDLERYGRTDIDFYKIDDENFYMDFSV